MPCPVIQKNTTILPSPGADLTVLIPAGLLAPPRASLQGGGPGTTGAHPPHPQGSSPPITTSVFIDSPKQRFFYFPLLFVDAGAGEEEAGCQGTQPALPASPLPVLCHAALCRLALPNFCLKLNLKERKNWKGHGSLLYRTCPLLSELGRGEAHLSPAPPPGPLGEGQECDLRSKTSCFILLFAQNQNHRLCLELLFHPSRTPRQYLPGVRAEQGIDP